MRKNPDGSLSRQYNFSRGVRGKYALRYKAGTNLVMLDPDVRQEFPTDRAVNRTLRAVSGLVKTAVKVRAG